MIFFPGKSIFILLTGFFVMPFVLICIVEVVEEEEAVFAKAARASDSAEAAVADPFSSGTEIAGPEEANMHQINVSTVPCL